jgi:hypothetical protein
MGVPKYEKTHVQLFHHVIRVFCSVSYMVKKNILQWTVKTGNLPVKICFGEKSNKCSNKTEKSDFQ